MAQKSSCLIKLENDSFVAIRKSNLILCDYNECAAALINYYEFRHNCKLAELHEKMANNRNYKVSEKDYLIQASNQYLINALLNQFSRNKVIEANALLMKLGYIKIVTNVSNPNGGKPVNHIVLNADFINQRLKQDVEQRLNEDVATSQIGRSQRLKQDVATSQIGRNIDILEDKNNIDLKIESEENFSNSSPSQISIEKNLTDLEKEEPTTHAIAPPPQKKDPDDSTDILTDSPPSQKIDLIDSEDGLKEKVVKLLENEVYLNYFKTNYSRLGFKEENTIEYAQMFVVQYFKNPETNFCALSDSDIKKKLALWSFIFNKVNKEIEDYERSLKNTAKEPVRVNISDRERFKRADITDF